MLCNAFYVKVEEKIGNVFSSYGRFLARHPWKFIIVSVLMNGLLGIGMLRLQTETDLATVYTPTDSEANKDSTKVGSLFPNSTASHFAGLQQLPDLGRQAEVIIRVKSGNLLDIAVLAEVENLYNYVSTTSIKNKGSNIDFANICARNIHGCVVDGDLFVSAAFNTSVAYGNVTYPFFQNSITGQIYYYEGLVGSASTNGSYLSSAQMLHLRFHIRTDIDSDIVGSWQDEFNSRMESFSSRIIEITYAHSDSLEKELANNITGDITWFTLTFTVMITYACIAAMTARCDCVGQRSNLGYCGVLAAGMAIVAAFGIVSACGTSFVSLVGVMPFLIIGIGVDDMFVLLSGLAEAQDKNSVEDKIAETMRTSGVAITITSLTDLLAFAAGASSIFLGVRNFCLYTGVAVIFCYLNQATFFVACLTLHENRVAENRHCMTCMKVQTKEEARRSEKGNKYIICCAGSPPTSRKEVESYLDKLPGWLIPKIVLKMPCKIIILFLFTCYLASSIYGVTIMEQGLDLKNLVAESSHYYKYRQWLDGNFPALMPVSFVISETVKYSDKNTQNAITSLLKSATSNSKVKDDFEINWLSAYKQTALFNDSSESSFVTNLNILLSTNAAFERYKNDIVIDQLKNVITASRFYVMAENLKSTTEEATLMLDMRDVAKSSALSTFAFAPAFIFYEQYVAILPQTLQTLGIAVATVFFVTAIFMPHPLLLLYVTITVTMIMIGIFGFLPYIGLTLSSITMMHIIMSIGFSVDFTAHICHGFMISCKNTRNERVGDAIVRSGAPIFHGAASSILGVVFLLAAASYIFRSFFRVMGLVIIFGIAHALFLLPVVLSFVGPHPAVRGSVPGVPSFIGNHSAVRRSVSPTPDEEQSRMDGNFSNFQNSRDKQPKLSRNTSPVLNEQPINLDETGINLHEQYIQNWQT